MKKALFLTGILFLVFGLASAQSMKESGKEVAKGETNTPFGNYKVEVQTEPVILEGVPVTAYRISYENSPVSIVVLVDKEKNCKNYVVVSEGLSVMYTCNGKYFGVNVIDSKYNKEGYTTDVESLNHDKFMHQKLIVQGYQDELNATKLIACYYPLLIK